MPVLSPLESEFESTEQAEAYDLWLRAKVLAVLASEKTKVSHDEAMAEAKHVIESHRHVTPDLEH